MYFYIIVSQVNCMMYVLNRVSANYDEKNYRDRVTRSSTESITPTLGFYLAVILPFLYGLGSTYKAIELTAIYTGICSIFFFNFSEKNLVNA